MAPMRNAIMAITAAIASALDTYFSMVFRLGNLSLILSMSSFLAVSTDSCCFRLYFKGSPNSTGSPGFVKVYVPDSPSRAFGFGSRPRSPSSEIPSTGPSPPYTMNANKIKIIIPTGDPFSF
eukprot:NODE_242_length_11906_cov_0.577454.p5 type:complete len:122 gc:universal NODE_242_length_11906_cov_0.577454:1685-1320(-)